MIAHFSQGDEEHENTAQVVGRFGKPARQFYPLLWSDL
jgi:hypothetical protein